jgi:tRNA U34 5-methylaminomethyl-2-thiouridine-forming methyltransferase MnmC
MESIYSIPDLVMTQDGSYTLYSKEHGVTYHSRYGAVQESNHVFIHSGLLPFLKKQDKISILELGFGTGLNVLLTWKNMADIEKASIDYHSFDIFPQKRGRSLHGIM